MPGRLVVSFYRWGLVDRRGPAPMALLGVVVATWKNELQRRQGHDGRTQHTGEREGDEPAAVDF